jgi:hypothetical protein
MSHENDNEVTKITPEKVVKAAAIAGLFHSSQM